MKRKLFPILALLLMAATGATAQTTYTVTVKDGTEDADKWSADPNPAAAGQTVTVTYTGAKKVKSVKAVKKALAPAAVDLEATTTAWADADRGYNADADRGYNADAEQGHKLGQRRNAHYRRHGQLRHRQHRQQSQTMRAE